MPDATTTRRATWARGSFRTAAHLLVGGRKTQCGTHLGYGLLEHVPDDLTWTVHRCRRCLASVHSNNQR